LNWKKMATPLLLAFSLALSATGVSVAAPAKAVSRAPAPAPAPAAKLPGGSEGRSAFFVSLDWLKDNLRGVVLLDARPASLYVGGHVPGAVNAEWQSFSKMSGRPGSRGWATLLAPKSIAARIGALGIDGSRPVIVYGEPGSWGQEGFVALTLRMAGVSGVRILDGGWPAWRGAGLPVTKEVPKPRPANFRMKAFREDLNATAEHIRERMGSAKLLDVRTLEEYRGARYFSEKRGGHIPGAILVPYNSLVGRDGLLLQDADLKSLFTGAGILPEDEIIVYDTAGVRSAYATWVLLMLGYPNVRNYDASFHEWAGMSELSVETGDPGELPVLVAAPGSAPSAEPVSPQVKSPDLQPLPITAAPSSADAKPQALKPIPIVVTPVSPDVKPQALKPIPIVVTPVSPDVKPQALKPIPIVVKPVSPPAASADAKPAAEEKPMVQVKAVVEAPKILALRWNRDGKTIRAVVDLDRFAEPKVLVKPNLVELSFNALSVASMKGLPSPFEKDVSAVLVQSGNQATLRFSHKAGGVKHFQLEKPYRYVVDFRF
jgi:thiosulfate/3-mercaptopyruvate sulfurtransferase